MAKTTDNEQNRRRYHRINTVLPVQFRLVSFEGRHFLSGWLQGFTSNISKGGICLAVNNLNPELAALVISKEVKTSMDIEMPVSRNPISALAHIAWVKEQILPTGNKYLIGLSYDEINPVHNRLIMRYVWLKKLFFPISASVILLLGLGLVVNSIMTARLMEGNKLLVAELLKNVNDSNSARAKIKEMDTEKLKLESELSRLHVMIGSLEAERDSLNRKNNKVEELASRIEEVTRQKEALQKELAALNSTQSAEVKKLDLLSKEKLKLEKANVSKMYDWISVHQNPSNGLVMSFEGDRDIRGWSFIYDQSLAAQVFMIFADFDRAAMMLDFFDSKAQRIDGLFLNAYYFNDGSPAEYTVHAGPNIWLGIAALQYTHKTGDTSFLSMAEEIANGIMQLQNEDEEGGIRGGPNFGWYSTEHNLDAYAFFDMLHIITGKAIYKTARDKTSAWLKKHIYDKGDVPIRRGKGDSTIATDTYAWAIASFGPETLIDMKMDPDKIIEFAENNCVVEVPFCRLDGQIVKVKGFDFAPERGLARGGVVSAEWTGQMIVTMKIMSAYYSSKGIPEKAALYANKADEYLSELSKMIISSPSPSGQGESCLPYATQDFVDTGHGWMTPKGKDTGSLSGTAYAIFAYYNHNPLKFKKDGQKN
ncbi:MAG: hypothetical protein C4533_00295 [Candidatus Omnitrophota bacterium]|jgi:hypothetical protein|nr:MAG: hypothetical protein C4533_00295 [Candidatus Omnitrophota bacterium]